MCLNLPLITRETLSTRWLTMRNEKSLRRQLENFKRRCLLVSCCSTWKNNKPENRPMKTSCYVLPNDTEGFPTGIKWLIGCWFVARVTCSRVIIWEPGGEVFARTVVVFFGIVGGHAGWLRMKSGIFFCTINYRNKFPWIPHLTIYANLRFLSHFVNFFDVLEKSLPLIYNEFLWKSCRLFCL